MNTLFLNCDSRRRGSSTITGWSSSSSANRSSPALMASTTEGASFSLRMRLINLIRPYRSSPSWVDTARRSNPCWALSASRAASGEEKVASLKSERVRRASPRDEAQSEQRSSLSESDPLSDGGGRLAGIWKDMVSGWGGAITTPCTSPLPLPLRSRLLLADDFMLRKICFRRWRFMCGAKYHSVKRAQWIRCVTNETRRTRLASKVNNIDSSRTSYTSFNVLRQLCPSW